MIEDVVIFGGGLFTFFSMWCVVRALKHVLWTTDVRSSRSAIRPSTGSFAPASNAASQTDVRVERMQIAGDDNEKKLRAFFTSCFGGDGYRTVGSEHDPTLVKNAASLECAPNPIVVRIDRLAAHQLVAIRKALKARGDIETWNTVRSRLLSAAIRIRLRRQRTHADLYELTAGDDQNSGPTGDSRLCILSTHNSMLDHDERITPFSLAQKADVGFREAETWLKRRYPLVNAPERDLDPSLTTSEASRSALSAIARAETQLMNEINGLYDSIVINATHDTARSAITVEPAAELLPPWVQEEIHSINEIVSEGLQRKTDPTSEYAFTLAETGRYLADTLAAYTDARSADPTKADTLLRGQLAIIKDGIEARRPTTDPLQALKTNDAFLRERFGLPADCGDDTPSIAIFDQNG